MKAPEMKYLCLQKLEEGFKGPSAKLAKEVGCCKRTALAAINFYKKEPRDKVLKFLNDYDHGNRVDDSKPEPKQVKPKPVRGFRTPYNVLLDRERIFVSRY